MRENETYMNTTADSELHEEKSENMCKRCDSRSCRRPSEKRTRTPKDGDEGAHKTAQVRGRQSEKWAARK